MKYLIIYAHPDKKSLNAAILADLKAHIGGKSEVKVIDLYADKFDPVLVHNAQNRRTDLHKDPETAQYREMISWADHIIFQYPIWWGRGPAILLGFIDRLFVSNFAYKKNGGILPEGLLKDKKADVIATMDAKSGFLYRLWSNNSHRILMKKQLLNYCGIKAVRFYEINDAANITPIQLERHMVKIKALYS